MKLIPLNKSTIPLILTCFLSFGFFLGGLFKVLDYFIVKVLLFSVFGVLLIWAFSAAIRNESKKNRPEDKLQDDSH